MKFRTAIVALLFVVGAVSFTAADTIQIRFLDENGLPIEGQGATKVDAVGTPMLKLPVSSSTQSVYTVEATPGEKIAFVIENPASIVNFFEVEVPADVQGVIDLQAGTQTPSGSGVPANDTCDGAIPVAVPSVTGGATTGATTDTGTPTCGSASVTSPGVWYSFIGTGLTVTASTCNAANFDTKISILCKGCDVQECTGGFDDYPGCAGFTTQVTVPTQAGQEYLVLVHGFGGATGAFNLSLSEGAPADFGPVDCAPTGACCDCSAPPFNCTETSLAGCDALGGAFGAANSQCISPANMPTTYASAPNAPISNVLDPTTDTITIPTAYVVADVDVEVNIAHTWIADMEVILSHAGISQQLWGNRCGSTDNIRATITDDEGQGNLTTLCADINAGPSNAVFFSSEVAGAGPLSVFDGSDAFGDWTISIEDSFGGDDGTLEDWALIVDAGQPNCPDQNNGSCFLCADDGPVTICHYPPGNNANGQTITVGAASVAAHMAQHGDTMGPCEGNGNWGDDDDDPFELRQNDSGPRHNHGGVDVRRVN